MSENVSDILRADFLQPPLYGLAPMGAMPIVAKSPTLDETRAILRDRQKRLEQELLETNALINACAPINRLPVEMLAEIFMCVQGGPREDAKQEAMWSPSSLCQTVCRHWFVVSASTPRLWQSLVVQGRPDYFRTALVRSKATQISIVIKRTLDPVSEEAFALLIRTPGALQRVRRIIIRKCYYTSSSRPLTTLLQHPMPALEALVYFQHYELDVLDFEVLHLARERLPKLKYISASGVSVSPSPLLGQITNLELSGHRMQGRINLATLVQVLQACSEVENVTISYVDRQATGNDHLPQVRVRRHPLPRLRKLDVQNVDVGVTRGLLSAFSLPATAKVALYCCFDHEVTEAEVAQGLHAVIPDDRNGLPLLSTLVAASVAQYPAEIYAYSSPVSDDTLSRKPSFQINVNRPRTTHLVAQMPVFVDSFDILRNAPLEELRLSPGCVIIPEAGYDFVAIDWRAAFTTFPRLRCLILDGHDYDCEEEGALACVQSLDPSTAPEGTQDDDRLLLPRLRSLELGCFNANDALFPLHVKAILEGRRAALGQSEVLEELIFAPKHRRLENPGQFEELEARYLESFGSYAARVTYKWV